MKRLLILAVLMILSLSSIPAFSAMNSKAGTTCSKINSKTSNSTTVYICKKIKQKMVWTVDLKSEAKSIVITSKKTPLDYVDIRGRLVYGIRNSKLIRQADNGKYFDSDSRELNNFNEIRLRAYKELNIQSNDLTHPNVEFDYRISPNFPKIIIAFQKRGLEESAALWNSYFKTKIKIVVYFVTEKDKEFILQSEWMNRNLANVLPRFENHGERPFISGGAGYWKHYDSTYGELYLATASDLTLTYVNYEWPQLSRHEFTHIVQDYSFNLLGEKNIPSPMDYTKARPINFSEGSANTFGYLTGFENIGWASDALDQNLRFNLRNFPLQISIDTVEDAKNAFYKTENEQSGDAFDLSYPIGSQLYEYVIGKYGFEGFIRILKEMPKNNSFDETIKNALGISKDQLYEDAGKYLFLNVQRLQPYK